MCEALIIMFLGTIPARGSVVPIPKAIARTATPETRRQAKVCARHYHLRLRIVEDN